MTINICITFKVSTDKLDKNDSNNPFNGSLSIRGKLFQGKVIKAKAKDTVVLEKDSPIQFPKFRRYGRGKSRIHAHVPSNLVVHQGDTVLAAECRPISKWVSFVVIEVKA